MQQEPSIERVEPSIERVSPSESEIPAQADLQGPSDPTFAEESVTYLLAPDPEFNRPMDALPPEPELRPKPSSVVERELPSTSPEPPVQRVDDASQQLPTVVQQPPQLPAEKPPIKVRRATQW